MAKKNQSFWDNLDPLLSEVRYMEFTGGEPFMIQEHFDLLSRLVETGVAKDIEIHYNTNGTMYPEHAEEIWQHFKTVEIAFSIDDLGPRFEYQRMNAQWDKVNENIQKFRLLRHRWSNIQLQVCSTVNVFNVMYLEGLANWIDQQDFDFIYWNMLHEAYYHSVSTLPDKAKKTAISRLNAADVSERHKTEFSRIVDFIGNGVSLDGNILRMKVADVDWRRKQDLRTHHPELAEAIDYEGPQ